MNLVKVTIKRTATADGLCELKDTVKVGDQYIADLDRTGLMKWGHKDSESVETRDSVWVYADRGSSSGWMPKELFGI